MHIVRPVPASATIGIGRQAASIDLGAEPGLPVRSGLETEKAVTVSIVFPLRRALLQGCRERRIARSTVDEFGGGAQRDHHASGRVANRSPRSRRLP